MLPIYAIQSELRTQHVDGWLFYDFHHRDPIAARVLGLRTGMGTRRWFYFIPRRGQPRKLVHRIESAALDGLPGKTAMYAGLETLHSGLRRMLAGCRTVAMQYSPRNAIPYISMVDAGTVELVRAQGCRVVSSADLVQRFEATWTPAQYRSHLDAGRIIHDVISAAFARAAARVRRPRTSPLTEYELQQWMLKQFHANGVVTDDPPIVAVGRHAGDPHYEPRAAGSSRIRCGDLLLLDVWGRMDRRDSVYYDVTWVAYLGREVPLKFAQVFAVVSQARDGAIAFVRESIAARRPIRGWQVDRVARDIICNAGYGNYFVHRTGHSIGQQVHGAGANMDSLETHDERRILPRTCFSIEPGIYLPEFGIRSEVNVYIDHRTARVTGPVQEKILALLR
jgi:Xaa-Pro dipeptidase